MIFTLWKNRQRPPLFHPLWWKAWAKRGLQFIPLLQQWALHARLRCHRATISSSAFVSSTKGFSADLSQLKIGEDTFVGQVELSVVSPITLGRSVCINDGAKLLTGSHDPSHPSWRSISAPITVGDFAWIGTNALILPGVTIGEGAVVGAGAVVAKDVSPYTIVVGNPARPVPKTRCESLNYRPAAMVAVYAAWLPLADRS